MEWLGSMERLSPENVKLETACNLLKGLYKIHKAGVLHYDLYARNMMVTPGGGRAVWIDFSCAHMNRVSEHEQEYNMATGIILEAVSPHFG
jgi:tRNA A-37 threonylcarbamoyl transferase component Bud32